jgi:hypothetical protein
LVILKKETSKCFLSLFSIFHRQGEEKDHPTFRLNNKYISKGFLYPLPSIVGVVLQGGIPLK